MLVSPALIQLCRFWYQYLYIALQCTVQTYSTRKMYLLTAKPAVTVSKKKKKQTHAIKSFFLQTWPLVLLSEILYFLTSKSLERNMPSKNQCLLNFTQNSIDKFVHKYFKPVDPRAVMTHKHRVVNYLRSFGTVRVGTVISLKIGT